MHKPRSQGGEVSQMSTLYYNSYLVKVATKGEGGSKISKKWLRGLCMTPKKSQRRFHSWCTIQVHF